MPEVIPPTRDDGSASQAMVPAPSPRHGCRKCGANVAERPRDGVCKACLLPVAWSYLPQPVKLGHASALRWVRAGLALMVAAAGFWWLGAAYAGWCVLTGEPVEFLPRLMFVFFVLSHACWTAGVVAILFCPGQDTEQKSAGGGAVEALVAALAILSLGGTIAALGAYEALRLGEDGPLALLLLAATLPAFLMPALTSLATTQWLLGVLRGWCWMTQARRIGFAGLVLGASSAVMFALILLACVGAVVWVGGLDFGRVINGILPVVLMGLGVQSLAGTLWVVEAVRLWLRLGVPTLTYEARS